MNKKTTVILAITFIFTLFFLISFLLQTKEANADIFTGLVSHWKLDETTGTIAADSAGTSNGTLTNGPTWVTGKLNNALSFDGTNDYVNLGTRKTTGLNEATLSMWIKPNTTTATATIFDESSGAYWQFAARIDKWYTRDASTGSTGARDNDLSLPSLPTGQWSHLVFA